LLSLAETCGQPPVTERYRIAAIVVGDTNSMLG